MALQTAVVMQGGQSVKVVSDRPIPRLRDGYLLVKVVAVALNPTDWKHIDFLNTPGSLSGCDYAGTVEEVGTGYSKDWKFGDRICGAAHGGNSLQLEDGAFAEHIVVKADLQLRLPDHMSFEEGATLGVGVGTVGIGLFQKMGLNLPVSPTDNPEVVLIYGGSSATGTLGIQFAKLAGYKPITTCSPRNFDLVKSLGAAAVFNYHDTDCSEQIRKYTDSNLRYAWDTIAVESSIKICAEALAEDKTVHYGTIGAQQPVDLSRDDLVVTKTMLYLAIGEPVHKWGRKFDADPKSFEFAKGFMVIAEKLLAEGKIKVHPPKVMEGGLESVIEGLDLLRKNQVSGEKLVYRIA